MEQIDNYIKVDAVEGNTIAKQVSFAKRLYNTMIGTCQTFGQIERFLKKDEVFETPSPKPKKISFGVLNYAVLRSPNPLPFRRCQSTIFDSISGEFRHNCIKI